MAVVPGKRKSVSAQRLRRAAGRLAQRVLGKRLFCLLRLGHTNPNTARYWDGVYAGEGLSERRFYPNLHQAILRALPPGALVLDAGCGPGHLMEACCQAGCRALGIDLSFEALRLCRGRGLVGCVAALPDLPFADRAFDAVILSEVVEHLSNPKAALAAAARLLRPGGRLIVTVPDSGERGSDRCIEHIRAFDARSLSQLLEAVPGLAGDRTVTVAEDWNQRRLVAVATVRS
jgi:SAM-dependent methyltransferase